MEVLHITLQSLEQDIIDLRYWKEREAEYEDKQLRISEIEDLITLCQRDYYALRPQPTTIGQRLYRWLDREGRWLTRAISDCAAEGIVLAIAPSQKLAHLPWEVLHDGQGFLVEKSYPLIAPVRWVNKLMEPLPPQPRSLQVLFMATSPENVQPVLDFEYEESAILRITESLPLTLRVEESGCVDELQKRWNLHQQGTFDIFHLTGHANISSEEPYEPYFITETLTGERSNTKPEQLRQAFGARRPRLIFLSGCRTGESGDNGSVPSFAETFIEQGMPAVMGWGRPVRETTATKCAATLYERLAAGDELAQALSLTFQALINDKDVNDWHLLRLYVRGESWEALVDAPEFYVPPTTVQKQFLDSERTIPVATPEEYVGRRRLLQKALRSLKSGSHFGLMLQGMGGLGKSSTAARLLERLPEYQPVVFYRAIDAAKLERTLDRQCLSEQGRAILNSTLPLMQKLTAFLDQGLNQPKQRFIFVLDDFEANLEIDSGDQAILKGGVVDCLNALFQALKQCRTPHRLLITSRYDVRFPECNESIERIPLTSLKDADLRKKCDRLEGLQANNKRQRTEVQQQAIQLSDGNPRLLEWLNKVFLEPSIESESILKSLEAKSAEFREGILVEQLLNQQSDAVLIMLSRMQLYELPVPFEAISAICPEIEQLGEHCKKATALGLLEWDGVEKSTYRLPRVFMPLLEPLTDFSRYASGVEVLYEAWWEQAERTEEKATELIRLAALTEKHEIEDTVASSLGIVWREQGRYRDAIRIWERINGQRKKLLGSEHPDVATSLNNLAGLYDHQGRYEEAEPLYRQALEMSQKLLGSEHPDVATSLNNLAGLYDHQGRYEEAEPLYRQALEMRKKLLGAEHPSVATSLNNLAGLYYGQGRYAEAEPLYCQALEMKKKLLGLEHIEVATSINNLAALYDHQGRYEESESLYQQALEIKSKLLGLEHPEIATYLNNLANLHTNQGRYAEAESLFQQALEMRKELLGLEHPEVATSLNNLAGLFTKQGRYEEAEPRYIKALAILIKRLGENHPNTQIVFSNFIQSLNEALKLGQADGLSDHPTTQAILQRLCDRD